MVNVVIASAVRTAIGKFGGTLQNVRAPDLGGMVISESISRAGISNEEVNEVIMGNVISAGIGQNPARQAMIAAGLPYSIPAFTVNKVCGSGMKAIILAAQAIKAGDANVIVAGGMENMNLAPFLLPKARYGYRLGEGKLVDAMVNDGLWDYYNDFHMGNTGELIAEKYGITREESDEFAARSHRLAIETIKSGKFKPEIAPYHIKQRKGEPLIFDTDESPREDTSIEKLASLKPVFKKDGQVTAGNASQISDGASALVVMSEDYAKENGITALARIAEYESGGCEPEMVMDAPVVTTRKMFARTGLTINDIDLVEHNEAFASASVAVKKALEIPEEKFNVRGGAVALGHPIGCSGARIVTTLLYGMKDKGAHRGLATVCLGGGNAVTIVLEQ
ncbi:MAG: acetyl-CoA C-acetyltransferase [Candidatus Thermoplasmatota archaeon]|nr:acetyl-CoA C-acetyltransferase [Euryarchaeota archaeon]MBU4032244.1 acetyl-CoA C-acetyltransferase [Candidatus Thermoplasmatota archaeon]MBU4071431.1 acetyl-CoA C-acetyltransferase [Candidatus Thermoplasmatota archaeon]MBU4144423.1 acetyl-CoA C-acetyltransferase [Candidatus Thermoplasmatota archaeon]MBU4591083.1 acetyl-CoA C-acetyltransferase [Candidatus Thermoplasmatota archaeon]